jgi:hypothetical protein
VGLLEIAYPYAEDPGFLAEARGTLFPHLSPKETLEAVRFFLDHLIRNPSGAFPQVRARA